MESIVAGEGVFGRVGEGLLDENRFCSHKVACESHSHLLWFHTLCNATLTAAHTHTHFTIRS